MPVENIDRDYVIHRCTPRDVFDVVIDYASYPRVFPEFAQARILEDHGIRRRAEFLLDMVVAMRFVLDIIHDEQALTTNWTLVEGNLISLLEGGWRFVEQGYDTRMYLHAGVTVKAFLPPMLKRKISRLLLASSIPNVFRAVEHEVILRQRSYVSRT